MLGKEFGPGKCSSWFPGRKVNEFASWVSYIKGNLTHGNRMKTIALNRLPYCWLHRRWEVLGMWKDRGTCGSENGRGCWWEGQVRWKSVRWLLENVIRKVPLYQKNICFCEEGRLVIEDVALFQKNHRLLHFTRNVRQGRGLALEKAAAEFPEETWMEFSCWVPSIKLNLTDGNSWEPAARASVWHRSGGEARCNLTI